MQSLSKNIELKSPSNDKIVRNGKTRTGNIGLALVSIDFEEGTTLNSECEFSPVG
jgi:hypothetical protein